jgi:hypothetical protein
MATKKQAATKKGNEKGAGAQEPEVKAKVTDKLTTKKTLTKEQVEALLVADEGAGSENIGAKDMAIPRISILQKGSPQCDKAEGAYIKGAEPGDFYDNVANKVFAKGEEGFLLVPVSYRRANLEWITKKQGGGFVADHGSDDSILSKCTKNADNQMILPNGHEVVTTAEYFCIVLFQDATIPPAQAVISMAKTQLKKARKLNTMIQSLMIDRPNGQGRFNPAMFYSTFAVTTVPESNDKGSWMGWNITRHGDTMLLHDGQEIYLAARQFREAVSSGDVKVANPTEDAAGGDQGAPDDGKTL